MPEARYDGQTDWYDSFAAAYMPIFAELVASHAGAVDVVVDVGCGTGLHVDALRSRGIAAVGIELSLDQLRVARTRNHRLVRGDAAALPVATESVDCVLSTFVHTDVDDFGAMVVEVARLLRAGGRFVYVGTHPCFIGGFAHRADEQGEMTLRAGYGSGDISYQGTLSAHVGTRSRSLADFLGAFLAAGLVIGTFDELDTRASHWTGDDGTVVPWNVLVVAAKPAPVAP